jgi:hypothetical protein
MVEACSKDYSIVFVIILIIMWSIFSLLIVFDHYMIT